MKTRMFIMMVIVLLIIALGCAKNVKFYTNGTLSAEVLYGEWKPFENDVKGHRIGLIIEKDSVSVISGLNGEKEEKIAIEKISEFNEDSQSYSVFGSDFKEPLVIQVVNHDVIAVDTLGSGTFKRPGTVGKEADIGDLLGKWKPKNGSGCCEVDVREDGIQFYESYDGDFMKILKVVSIGDARVFVVKRTDYGIYSFAVKVIDNDSVMIFDGRGGVLVRGD